MTIEIISWSISTKVWDRAGIELATPGSAVRLASVARHVTDCATRPGTGYNWGRYLTGKAWHNTIRIYHECEQGKKNPSRGSSIGITRLAELWQTVITRPILTQIMDIFLAHLILYWKNMKRTSRKSWINWDVTWWCNFNITMMSRIEVRPTCCFIFYLSHKLVLVCEIEWVKRTEILIWCER